MKKLFSLAISMLLLVSLATTASAQEVQSDVVIAKQALAQKYAYQYNPDYESTPQGKERKDKIVDLVCKIQANVVNEMEAYNELKAVGVYKLEYNDDGAITPFASEPSNIQMNNVITLYDSYNSQWLVCGGGYWKNDSDWMDDVPLNFFPYVGQKLNVGGYDGIGVKLYNTSGTYNTRIKESYAYYSDGNEDFYNYSPSIYDGKKGAYFQYQDKAVVRATNGFFSSYTYIGKHFSAMLIYDSNFSNFHGYARTQYTHTWSSAQIEGVSFGASGTSPTFQVTIKNASKSFECYATGETRF